MDPSALLVLGVLLAVFAAVLLARRRERARGERGTETLRRSEADESHLPPSLHPVVDPEICIGSLSCVKACPEGDIPGIADRRVTLLQGSHCIGHGRCAVECPVGAIKLVFGSSQRGVDLSEVSATFESSRPGVFVVGELGGMGSHPERDAPGYPGRRTSRARPRTHGRRD